MHFDEVDILEGDAGAGEEFVYGVGWAEEHADVVKVEGAGGAGFDGGEGGGGRVCVLCFRV